MLAARASYLAGCSGSSNTFAGHRFGVPVFGTQAHSWIMAHDSEQQAFEEFIRLFHGETTLLVDTYDVHSAVENLIASGKKPRGIRLDSGDMAADSIWARNALDRAGWTDVGVFASGDLDEDRIAALLQAGAKIDAFGVGTSLSVSLDAPALSVVYKLVEIERNNSVRFPAKFSESKITYPGRKQVFRSADTNGRFTGDVIALEDESAAMSVSAHPLLRLVMQEGKRLTDIERGSEALAQARERCAAQLRSLPESLRLLDPPRALYPVRYTQKLEALLTKVSREHGVEPEEVLRARGRV